MGLLTVHCNQLAHEKIGSYTEQLHITVKIVTHRIKDKIFTVCMKYCALSDLDKLKALKIAISRARSNFCRARSIEAWLQ